MGAIRDAFNTAWRDFVTDGVPASGKYNPVKSLIRSLGGQLEDAIEGAAAGAVQVATWAALDAITGTREGQPGRVAVTDEGTHTDPVVGGTVDNAGEYSWSESEEGWQRIGDLFDPSGLGGLALKDTVEETDLDTGAVTEEKLGTGAVTEDKIGDGAATTAKIADDAVTNAKLADVPQYTLKGRNFGGTGVVVDIGLTDAKSMLGISTLETTTASLGLRSVAASGNNNLFDTTTCTDGQRLFSNGTISANEDWTVSDFIPIDGGATYSRNVGGGQIVFYNQFKTVASGQTGSTARIFVAPGNAYYMRVSVAMTNKDATVIVRGATTPNHTWRAAKNKVPLLTLNEDEVGLAAFPDNKLRTRFKVDERNLSHLQRDSINLFDKDAVVANQLLQFNQITASATTSVSEYIPVSPSTSYTRTQEVAWEEYDANMLWLESHASGGGATITTRADTAYVRFPVLNSTLNTFMFVEGDELPVNLYVPYRQYKPRSGTGLLYGKTVVFLGDSNVEASNHPRLIQDRHGGLMINGGFGGTRMAEHRISGSITAYDGLSAYRLAPQVAASDFTDALATAEDIYDPPTVNDYNHNIVELLEWVDFASVDAIVFDYGSNDWGGDVALGTFAGGPDADGESFIGAMRYVIETILTAHPHIQLLFKTPAWRVSSASPNGIGLYLHEYADAIIETAAAYNLPPVLDLNRHSGINSLTEGYYLIDDAHYSDAGKAMAATMIGMWITRHV